MTVPPYTMVFDPGDPDPCSPYHGAQWYAWVGDPNAGGLLAGVGATEAEARAEADENVHDVQARLIDQNHMLILAESYEDETP